jgi:hypothetical protein
MIAIVITGAITLVCLSALAVSWSTNRAEDRRKILAIRAATETAFTRDSVPQAARDAALKHLEENAK